MHTHSDRREEERMGRDTSMSAGRCVEADVPDWLSMAELTG